VFQGNPLPPLNTLGANVQEQPAPTSPPVPRDDQGLVDTPEMGTSSLITWRQIDTFWSGDVDKNNVGSGFARKEMRNGQLVPAKFKRSTNEAKRKTFDLVRKHFRAE
jgi:hypothetical protein